MIKFELEKIMKIKKMGKGEGALGTCKSSPFHKQENS